MNTNQQLANLLEATATRLKVATERVLELEEKVAGYERKEVCVKIANDMRARHLLSDNVGYEDLVQRLMGESDEKLATLKEAVSMVSPNHYADFRVGTPSSGYDNSLYTGQPSSQSTAALDSWARGG